MYLCVICLHKFCNMVFSFFATLGLFGLIIVQHFPKKCDNATIPRSGKNTATKEQIQENMLHKSGSRKFQSVYLMWLSDTLYIYNLQCNSILC